MRILFIGDIVGRSGRNVLLNHMPKLIAEWVSLCRSQRRNAARLQHPRSIYNDLCCRRRRHHARQSCARTARALLFIERAPRHFARSTFRPARPARRRHDRHQNGARALVINAMGRSLSDRSTTRSRRSPRWPLSAGSADAIIIDMHCEATSETVDGLSLRWPRQSRSAPATRRPPTIASCRPAPRSCPTSA